MRAKEIRELVKIIETSNVGELEITRWLWGKIRISKAASHPAAITVSAPVEAQRPVATHTPVQPQPSERIVIESAPVVPVKESNLVEIKSPMVGTFYRSPSPESEAYVKDGDMITPGKILCIIEAMKLMNEIEAEIKGKIVKILVDNAQPVEFNQPLFLVEPVK